MQIEIGSKVWARGYNGGTRRGTLVGYTKSGQARVELESGKTIRTLFVTAQ